MRIKPWPVIPRAILFGALCFCIFSCSPDYVLEKQYEISTDGWLYKDTLNFPFEISDTSRRYRIQLDIDHEPDFNWQNMYVRIHTRFPSGKHISQPVSLEMADPAGVWHGDCSNALCKLHIDLQERTRFDEKGEYQITLEQFTRSDTLQGIQRIGLMILEGESSKAF